MSAVLLQTEHAKTTGWSFKHLWKEVAYQLNYFRSHAMYPGLNIQLYWIMYVKTCYKADAQKQEGINP